MTNIILFTQDERLQQNSIIWIYDRLNSTFFDYSTNCIYEDLPKLLNQISLVNYEFPLTGYLISKNNFSNFTYIENKLYFSKIGLPDFVNPEEISYYVLTKRDLKEIIAQNSNNFGQIFSYFSNTDTQQIETRKALSELLINTGIIKIGKPIANQLKKEIKIIGRILSEYDHLILNFLRNKNISNDFIDLYRLLAIDSYYLGNDFNSGLKYILKSLTFISKPSVQLLQSLNLVNEIQYYNSYSWNEGIKKFILRIIKGNDIKITNIDIKLILSILINLKIDDTDVLRPFVNHILSDSELSYYYHRYLISFNFNIDKIHEPKKLDKFYEDNTKYRFFEGCELQTEMKDLTNLYNKIILYRNILLKTRFNPDQIITDRSFSDNILEITSIIESSKNLDIVNWIKQPPISTIDNLIGLKEALFSNSTPNEKLIQIGELIEISKDKIIEVNSWITRVLLFCIDNYDEIDDQLIIQFLENVRNQNYITINTIIKSLLLNLINSRSLTNEEKFYLNEYLSLNIQDFSKEAIAELTLSLIQLERQPQMQIKQSDRTILQYTEKVIDESATFNSFTNLYDLILFPEELVDEIVSNKDLFNYVYLFFSYHVLLNEWQEYDTVDQPFYKLQQLKTYMKSLSEYKTKISDIKSNHPQVVDDITLDFLEIEMILSEEPSIALGKLNSLKLKLENMPKNENDWTRFNSLLEQCYDAMGLEQEIINYDDD